MVGSDQGTSRVDLVGVGVLIVGTSILSRIALLNNNKKKKKTINSI